MKLVYIFISLTFLSTAHAAVQSTEKGKIQFTEGHIAPHCRTIGFKENNTNTTHRFRIKRIDGSDISSVVLAALTTNADVQIWYDENVTTGCGTEPQVNYIRIYKD